MQIGETAFVVDLTTTNIHPIIQPKFNYIRMMTLNLPRAFALHNNTDKPKLCSHPENAQAQCHLFSSWAFSAKTNMPILTEFRNYIMLQISYNKIDFGIRDQHTRRVENKDSTYFQLESQIS